MRSYLAATSKDLLFLKSFEKRDPVVWLLRAGSGDNTKLFYGKC